MNLPPPPPPGSHEIPPPPGGDIPPPVSVDLSNIPPPAPEADQHEVDVLKRRKHFSWKKFGGEGFLVSVAFHLLLLIAGLFWIVTKWREPAQKVDAVFDTGSGGGSHGDKAKAFEHKMQQRQPMIVKSPSRIVSKSANASVSLPSTPTTSTASFASGLSAGGMSKGDGGGSGGGSGPGTGIGKGGKNLVSAFGRSGMTNNLLTGSIYDFYQTKDGKKSKHPQRGTGPTVNNLDWLTPLVTAYIETGWRDDRFSTYFKGPAVLGVPQILIPVCPDTAAPDAFEAKGKMTGGAWIVVYRGRVTAPETAEIRFVGNADNYLAVAMSGKNVLNYHCGKKFSEEVNIGVRRPLARGEWMKVQKGTSYDMAILIGDAGGVFSASLCYEKKDQPKKLFLFRTEWSDFSEFLQKGRGEIPQNIDPESPIWTCVSPTRTIR